MLNLFDTIFPRNGNVQFVILYIPSSLESLDVVMLRIHMTQLPIARSELTITSSQSRKVFLVDYWLEVDIYPREFVLDELHRAIQNANNGKTIVTIIVE